MYATSIKEGRKLALVTVILFSLGIGIYQAFAAVIIIEMFLYLYLIHINSNQKIFVEFIKKFMNLAIIILLSVVLYIFITKITQIWIKSSGYVEGGFFWDKRSWKDCIKGIAINAYSLITGTGHKSYKYLPLFYALLLSIFIKNCIVNKRFDKSFILICISASTLLMAVVLGREVHVRMMLPVMLFPSIVSYICFVEFYNSKNIRKFLFLTFIIVILSQTALMNDYHLHETFRFERDKQIAYDINKDILNETQGKFNDFDVALLTNCNMPLYDESVGVSFWSLGYGERQLQFLSYMGYSYQCASEEDYEFAKNYSVNMSVWPSTGSVVYLPENNLVIVNMINSEIFNQYFY